MKSRFIVLFFFCIPFIMNGQECLQSYSFDPLDTEHYTMSCGEISESGIKVIGSTCNFYTPLTTVSGDGSVESAELKFSVGFNAGKFKDENDLIKIFLYVNGETFKTKTIKGGSANKDLEYNEKIKIEPGSSFRARIAFICDEKNEFWQLEKGKLMFCIQNITNDSSIESVPAKNPLTAVKEREFVRLNWTTPASTSPNYFKIERSIDGKRYSFTGFVKETSSTGSTEYTFIDSRPDKPKSFYRVIQVNNAGDEKVVGEPVTVSY